MSPHKSFLLLYQTRSVCCHLNNPILSIISELLAQQSTNTTDAIKKGKESLYSWCRGARLKASTKWSHTVILPLHPGGPDAAAGVHCPGMSLAKRPQQSGYRLPFLSGLFLVHLPGFNLMAGSLKENASSLLAVVLFSLLPFKRCACADVGWLLITHPETPVPMLAPPIPYVWCHALTLTGNFAEHFV